MSPTGNGVLGPLLLALVAAILSRAGRALTLGRARSRLAAAARQAPGRLAERRVPIPVTVLSALQDAALPVAPERAWRLWLGGGPALAGAGLVVGGPTAATVVALTWLAVPVAMVVLRRGAAGRAVDAALPQALDAIARSLRGGAGPHQALAEIAAVTEGPLGVELRRVAADIGGGAGLERALNDFEHRHPLPGVRLSVAALLLGTEVGGAHARALDGVAESVRARAAIGAEVRALASQARLSGIVIAAAPVGFGLLAAGTDGATARFLLHTPLGAACLVAGLALDGIGALWMHRIAAVDG